MSKKIGVVVLNYINYMETIYCIDSLLAQRNADIQIVVVDNGSGNESSDVLYEKYSDVSFISFINLEYNLGFARGNNVGIKYAKEQLKCDFVIILNSDTILTSDSIVSSIEKSYVPGIGVLNFRCITEDNRELLPNSFSDNMYVRFVVRLLRDILIYQTERNRVFCKERGDFLGKYSIQGCAYVLTPDFFEQYSQLYPGTFLYNEEDALALYLKKGHLCTKMIDSAPIVHKEHKSTSEDILKIRQFKKIVIKNKIKIAGLVFLPQKIIIKKYS